MYVINVTYIYFYCNYMRSSPSYLINYKDLDIELDFELLQTEKKLSKYYEDVFGETQFVIDDKKKNFHNYRDMSDFLSHKFNKKYIITIKISHIYEF